MPKFARAAVMMAALAGLTLASATNAQDKGKKKVAGGRVEIREGKDEKFRFFIYGGNDKLLAMSTPSGFATAKDAEKAIDDMKEVLASAKVTMGKAKATDPEEEELIPKAKKKAPKAKDKGKDKDGQ